MIKKIITYFLLITCSLFSLRYLHYYGLLKQKQGYYGKFNVAFFEKNKFNVLFLGSSRSEMHYDTKIFDSITGKNSFNLSMAGSTPQSSYAILKAYLKNSKQPDYLIYEIDFHSLKKHSNQIKEFNNFFPFLSNTDLRHQFNKIDSRMNHFYFNPFYSFPFVGLKNISTSLHGWLNIPNQRDHLYYKGYFKQCVQPNLTYEKAIPYYSYFNLANRNYLDSIILLCKKNKIKITMVSSPVFAGGAIDIINKKQIIKQIENIAKQNNIKYFNLSSPTFCNKRYLFIDHFHLNYNGATKYTYIFSDIFNNNISI